MRRNGPYGKSSSMRVNFAAFVVNDMMFSVWRMKLEMFVLFWSSLLLSICFNIAEIAVLMSKSQSARAHLSAVYSDTRFQFADMSLNRSAYISNI